MPTDEIVITNGLEISPLTDLLMKRGTITNDELIEKWKKMSGT